MGDVRWLDEGEARMWRGYLELGRHLDRVLERNLTGSGLSMADYALLVPLSEAPDHWLRARDLGLQVGWDRSRLSHHLRRMEQRGLVRRRECPTDARGTDIELTDDGLRAVVAAAPGHVGAVRENFVDLLTPEEIATMTAVSDRVLDRARTSGGCQDGGCPASGCDAESAQDPAKEVG